MKVEEAGLKIRPWGLRTDRKALEAMGDDLVLLIRRAAYVDELRWVAWRARWMGLGALMVGSLFLAWSAIRGPGVHSDVAHSAEAAIAGASLLFMHVMVQRTRWVRAHPFDPRR